MIRIGTFYNLSNDVFEFFDFVEQEDLRVEIFILSGNSIKFLPESSNAK